MKSVFLIFLSSLLLLSQTTTKSSVKIGNFDYSKESSVIFTKDYHLFETFETYYRNTINPQAGCSILGINENTDSLYIKGYFSIIHNNLVCKEYYFFEKKQEADSIYRVFKQKKNGDLELKKLIFYKNGMERVDTSFCK